MKLAKIVKISISFNRLVFPVNFNWKSTLDMKHRNPESSLKKQQQQQQQQQKQKKPTETEKKLAELA